MSQGRRKGKERAWQSDEFEKHWRTARYTSTVRIKSQQKKRKNLTQAMEKDGAFRTREATRRRTPSGGSRGAEDVSSNAGRQSWKIGAEEGKKSWNRQSERAN